ncbi:MAG: hypothetical protein ACJA0H_001432 [Francisellaceae bacterium]|jgi:hypothetical protein
MQREQLAKFQKQIDSAIIGFLNLLDRKELLAKSIDFNSSLSKLNSSIQKSILTIQDTLYASLMVDIHAWLFDSSHNSSNSSLYKLLKLLVDRETKLNTKHLKRCYVTAPEVVTLNESVSNWQSEFTHMRETEFEQVLSSCAEKINCLLLSEQAERIKSLRDKFLAHKDGAYDVKSNGHKIGDVFYLLEHMKIILIDLNALFQRVSYPIDESEASAKESAQVYWSHVART